MFPMIISVDEVHQIKAIIAEVKAGAGIRKRIPYKDVELGVMIETPAAVMISDRSGEGSGFLLGIGTNDLSAVYTWQSTVRIRQLDPFYDSHHPAILHMMLQMIVDNGHKGGMLGWYLWRAWCRPVTYERVSGNGSG